MLHPHDLFPTAIININGLPNVISGILPPEPQEDKRFSDKWVVITPLSNVPLDECEAIPLTEKILVEWCGFEKCLNGLWCPMEYINIRLHESGTYSIYTSGGDTNLASKGILTLHKLQLLYLALTNEPLKITLP